ncbi:hypothetical protein LMG3441_04291 [Achromobacter kerstersii]|uniref:Uncharacterized protein n=1 Tax=Achromobacter kerstersii TaxID=1353890 RepID=A0A6S7BSC4_9BURK|nr:hypothetical protein LMG3441_04291 [Achromobacter kerstersii]
MQARWARLPVLQPAVKPEPVLAWGLPSARQSEQKLARQSEQKLARQSGQQLAQKPEQKPEQKPAQESDRQEREPVPAQE